MPRIQLVFSVLVLVQTFFLLSHYRKGSFSVEKKDKRVHILIISSWRSGSSLIGQIFGQHPDVFYLNEPGWQVWMTVSNANADTMQMAVRDVLRSAFHCDMSVFNSYLRDQEKVSNLFLWATSRALCSYPACDLLSRNDIANENVCKQFCGKSSFSKIEEACKIYSHTALKEFRLFDVKVLYSLLTDKSLNLKIIHVVRDPRAVEKSRDQTAFALVRDNKIIQSSARSSFTESKYNIKRKICQSHALIYQTATSNPPSFLKGRYMFVRYEDVIRKPVKLARKLYEFVDLKPNSRVEQWLYELTNGQGTGSKKELFHVTPRNATEVSMAWRNVLSLETVKAIQDVCWDAMTMFGYKFIHTERQLRKLSVDFVLPRLQSTF